MNILATNVSWANFLTVIGILIVIAGGAMGLLFNMLSKTKDTVQYKDNCETTVKMVLSEIKSVATIVTTKLDLHNEAFEKQISDIKEIIKNGNC